jgi:hypothetical protein
MQSRVNDATPLTDTALIAWLADAGHASDRHRRLAALANGDGYQRYLGMLIRLRDKVRELGVRRTAALVVSIARARLRRGAA